MAASNKFLTKSNEPVLIQEHCENLKEFLHHHSLKKSNIVLVTSGGTMVPLEKRTVRFIDNFSMGTRGSASAEYFLSRGYAVIFLHRQNSLRPFHRFFSLVNILDMVETNNSEEVVLKPDHQNTIKKHLEEYQRIKRNNQLISFTYTSVDDYLHMLRMCAQSLCCYGNQAMLYLAAAVSDFYIPRDNIPEHKIQSCDGSLSLNLQLVPKMLHPLVKEWCPRAFVVSFKLETDEGLMIDKAKAALDLYSHQVVVANALLTRKQQVTIVTPGNIQPIKMSEDELKSGIEIESHIVQQLSEMHIEFISKSM